MNIITKNFKENKLILLILILEYILVLGLSYILSYQWMVLVTLWFALSIYTFLKKNKTLTSKEQKLFIFTVITYPLIETIIKIMIDNNILYGWATLNRLEHFSWAVSFTVVTYMLFKNDLVKIENKSIKILILISIVTLIGVGNEIVEYILREFYNLRLYAYYPDTVKDMITNLLGALITSIVLYAKSK